jgi:hypothetical protein
MIVSSIIVFFLGLGHRVTTAADGYNTDKPGG